VTFPSTPLNQLADRINAVSSLSTIATQALRLANNPNTSAIDFKHLIDQDYTIATRLIRISNSVTFSPRTPITSTLSAILYIGLLETKNLLITMALQDLLRKDLTIGPYSRQALWRHSLSVAATTQFIATRLGLSNFEDAYLAGILKDFFF